MYSDPNMDSPPPRSQFHRPWSPHLYDPRFPTSQDYYQEPHAATHYQEPSLSYAIPPAARRREASDVSVDALDLADYSKTLRARQAEDPYPAFPPHPQSQPVSGRMPAAASYDSLVTPPTLASSGPSSASHPTHRRNAEHVSRQSTSFHGQYPSRRPFSMPSTPLASSHDHGSRGQPPPSSFPQRPLYSSSNEAHRPPPTEVDISSFPKWSQGWYAHGSTRTQGRTAGVDEDLYTPVPQSQLDSTRSRQSIFDPEYVHDAHRHDLYDPPPPQSSIGHDSSRTLLPWSNDPPEYGPPLDPQVKAERLKMLEREFGSAGKPKKDSGSKLIDEEGKPLAGTVDDKGNLVTVGPKRRLVMRILQVVFALGTCIPGIYAAIALKPKEKPPPANKPPAFVLYGISSITSVFLIYIFVFRPCCCVRSKPGSSHPLGSAANMGMMVLPVDGTNNKGKKGGKKGQAKKGQQPGQDVQVNLIVDPTAFQPPDESDGESEDEYRTQDGSAIGARKRRARRRRGLFEGLAMEEDWKRARSWAKKLAVIDVLGALIWAVVFVYLMIGQRCPAGAFGGWCNAYNVSTACACLLCVAFTCSIFFDVQDLHASKQSPRTRT